MTDPLKAQQLVARLVENTYKLIAFCQATDVKELCEQTEPYEQRIKRDIKELLEALTGEEPPSVHVDMAFHGDAASTQD